jgi:hypothetical protein
MILLTMDRRLRELTALAEAVKKEAQRMTSECRKVDDLLTVAFLAASEAHSALQRAQRVLAEHHKHEGETD